MTDWNDEREAATPRAAVAPPDVLFSGPGEMRARCRAFDWSVTPLGPVAQWPLSLRAMISTLLASRHPMFLWWGPSLIQIYNDAYRPTFGKDGRHPGALGMRGAEFWADIWDIIGPQIAQVMAGGDATWHEDQLVPIERNGRIEDVWWTYSYGPAFDDTGAVAGVLVICQETTQRVQFTARQERFIAAEQRVEATVAIAVLQGREMRYTVANPKYQQIIGNRDPVGKRVVEMFPDLAGSEIEGVLTTVFDTALPFVANNLLIRYDSHGTGEIDNYYDLLYHPLMTYENTVSGIIVVVVDVTERRRAILQRERHLSESEQLLSDAVQARATAELANRAKGEFLALMSHELRTPLNAIGGYAELMELGIRGPITTEQRRDLARIQASQRHLLGLINGILNYTRVEAGALHYAIGDVAMDEVIATCEALTAPQVLARRLAFEFGRCAMGLAVRADPEKLQQVVLNLVSNAIKFTEPGGVVALSCDAADRTVFLRVHDTGRGIPAEQLEHIFEPFLQLDARLTRTQEGLGLGLAISRDLARGMGGDLTVESTPGIGSTFTLTLARA